MNYYIDVKVCLTCALFYLIQAVTIDFEHIEIVMKSIVFILTVGYTLRRWHLLEKNKKE